jgi:hypothetical protein
MIQCPYGVYLQSQARMAENEAKAEQERLLADVLGRAAGCPYS